MFKLRVLFVIGISIPLYFSTVSDTPVGTVRLSDGAGNFSGRVEMWFGGKWASFCRESWDDKNNEVLCRQLGYGPPLAGNRRGSFAQSGAVEVHDVGITCSGNENRIVQCTNKTLGGGSVCRSMGYAHVECAGKNLNPTLLCKNL